MDAHSLGLRNPTFLCHLYLRSIVTDIASLVNRKMMSGEDTIPANHVCLPTERVMLVFFVF